MFYDISVDIMQIKKAIFYKDLNPALKQRIDAGVAVNLLLQTLQSSRTGASSSDGV